MMCSRIAQRRHEMWATTCPQCKGNARTGSARMLRAMQAWRPLCQYTSVVLLGLSFSRIPLYTACCEATIVTVWLWAFYFSGLVGRLRKLDV